MKFMYLFLMLCLVNVDLVAQPNITRSLFVKSKVCSKEDKGLFKRVALGNRVYCVSYANNGKSSTSNTDSKLVVLDQNFDTVRSNVYGGTGFDQLTQINILPNGHLLLSGTTTSKDIDLATVAHAYSAKELWLLEVDTLGIIIKGRTFGGSGGSDLWKTTIGSDGNIYTAGSSLAKDYDFTHFSYGIFDDDAWVAKLDTTFNLKWVKILPGNDADYCEAVEEVNINRFFLVYGTRSTNIELAGNLAKGSLDAMIMYIDSNGTELWKKRYGGSAVDQPGQSIVDLLTGCLYVAGISTSADGDITYRTGTKLVMAPNIYNHNIWITKIDTNGNVLYSKEYGPVTGGSEYVTAMTLFENKLWLGSYYHVGGIGDMESPEPSLSDTMDNAWIGITDTALNLICKYTIRTNCLARVQDFFKYNSNLYAFGYSNTCSPDSAYNTYSCDTIKNFDFILNLGDAPLGINDVVKENRGHLFKLLPNPVDKNVLIKFIGAKTKPNYLIQIFTANGKLLLKKECKTDVELDVSNWETGMYYVVVHQQNKQQCLSFLKQ